MARRCSCCAGRETTSSYRGSRRISRAVYGTTLLNFFTFVLYGINYHLSKCGLILFLGAAARAPAESECETATFLSETRTRTMNRAS